MVEFGESNMTIKISGKVDSVRFIHFSTYFYHIILYIIY